MSTPYVSINSSTKSWGFWPFGVDIVMSCKPYKNECSALFSTSFQKEMVLYLCILYFVWSLFDIKLFRHCAYVGLESR